MRYLIRMTRLISEDLGYFGLESRYSCLSGLRNLTKFLSNQAHGLHI